MNIRHGTFARLLLVLSLGLAVGLCAPSLAATQASQTAAADKPFVVEYYYKARWGYADEFIGLFKKNHLPVLKKEMELGRILQVTATSPRYHNTEDGRWDYRVTIVWKNVATSPRYHNTEDGRWDYRVTIVWKNVAISQDGFDPATITKQLFPDQETFKREEQRRFEILLAHWDLPIVDVDLNK